MEEIENTKAAEENAVDQEAAIERMEEEGEPAIDIDQELRAVTLCLIQLKKAKAAIKGIERFIDLMADSDDEGCMGLDDYKSHLQETYENLSRTIGETKASIEIFKDF